MEALSVIIPVFNSREYLESCISSVIAVNAVGATSLIHEIILVDDGSTDGSSDLCDKLASTSFEDCAIRVIHQHNQGVSAARNVGLRAATGTFVLFVDSDDTIDSEKLAELINIVAQDASTEMVVFGMSFDYYSGDRIYRQDAMLPPVEGIKSLDECRAMLYSLFESNAISPLWNKLIRRNLIQRSGAFLREDMFLYEDLEFSLRILAHCNSVYFYPEPIYHYRQASDEGNAGRRLKRIEHIPDIVDKVEDALVSFGDSNNILLSLYLVLAREKISCASKNDTSVVCDDFKKWIDNHGILNKISDNGWAMFLYENKVAVLLRRRKRAKIRHSIANTIKKTIGDFRNW